MIKYILASLLIVSTLTPRADATTISLSVMPETAVVGDTFTVNVVGDFGDEGLTAGGIRLFWDDAAAQLESFSFEGLPVDPGFSCPGAPACPFNPPGVFFVAWGTFPPPDIIPPGAGETVLGSFEFTALAPGVMDLLIEDAIDITGGWFGSDFNPMAPPTLFDTRVVIVPAPTTLALLALGMTLIVVGRARAAGWAQGDP